MNKFLLTCVSTSLLFLLMAPKAFSNSLSDGNSQGLNSGNDNSISMEKSNSANNNLSDRNSNSRSHGFGLNKNSVYEYINIIQEKEKNNEGIFGKCQVFTRPVLESEVGITSVFNDDDDNGLWIDTNKATILSNLKRTDSNILRNGLVNNEQKQLLVFYANCLKNYGSIIASSMKKGTFTTNIRKEFLLPEIKDFKKCVLQDNGLLCNSTDNRTYSIVLGENPSLLRGQNHIFSKENYFGMTATESYNRMSESATANERSSGTSTNTRTSASMKTGDLKDIKTGSSIKVGGQ